MLKRNLGVILLSVAFFVSGCGYTAHSLLPSDYKTIYVNSFENKIKITAEQTNVRMYRGYRPGLEATVTKTIIDRYLFDGNLKVADEGASDVVLKGSLVDFRKEPLRFDANDNIEEYRLIVTVDMSLEDVKTGKVVWNEKNFSGETTYRTQGTLAISESTAMDQAVVDLARRVVERTVEGW